MSMVAVSSGMGIFATFLKEHLIIDCKAIIIISVPSQLFSMGISSFDMSFIYKLEAK